jgi:hypothetical protein
LLISPLSSIQSSSITDLLTPLAKASKLPFIEIIRITAVFGTKG